MKITDMTRDYLEKFGCQKESFADLLEAAERLDGNTEAREKLLCHINNYKEGKLDFEVLTADSAKSAELVGIHKYTAAFIFYVALVPYALPYFEAVGLSETEWYDSMIDFRWKLEECYKCYGIWGTFVDWFGAFYTADRVAFGRLQFNLAEAVADYNSENFDIKKGDTVVAIHIPSDTRTPFSRENREAAYEKASKFFAPKFKDGKVIFRCGTWLLHPAHRQILPEKSNIRSFLDDFELDESSFKETDSNIWRLFYVRDYNGDPDTLPEETSLMRIYKEFIKAGGKLGSLTGYRKG